MRKVWPCSKGREWGLKPTPTSGSCSPNGENIKNPWTPTTALTDDNSMRTAAEAMIELSKRVPDRRVRPPLRPPTRWQLPIRPFRPRRLRRTVRPRKLRCRCRMGPRRPNSTMVEVRSTRSPATRHLPRRPTTPCSPRRPRRATRRKAACNLSPVTSRRRRRRRPAVRRMGPLSTARRRSSRFWPRPGRRLRAIPPRYSSTTR